MMLIIPLIRQSIRTPPFMGHCPVCGKVTLFIAFGGWFREDLKCVRCKSSARERAVIHYISVNWAGLSHMAVYEPSPASRSRAFFERRAANYAWSVYSPELLVDDMGCGGSSQDLECLTFGDESFDLVVSQDVFEHVANPAAAFAEVSRILVPGGSHVFTMPWYPGHPTQRQAELVDGQIAHLAPPEYHGDPFDSNGALVFNRFGSDIADLIGVSSGMTTTITEATETRMGICGDSMFIFHSVKPA
ncbi:MAG: class I SAM-dependent methyltransferase [Xanthomonadaceae bacterium]|nr:class I SAM-dependent methyltransferase [Xanthomonadaceae bacterium]